MHRFSWVSLRPVKYLYVPQFEGSRIRRTERKPERCTAPRSDPKMSTWLTARSEATCWSARRRALLLTTELCRDSLFSLPLLTSVENRLCTQRLPKFFAQKINEKVHTLGFHKKIFFWVGIKTDSHYLRQTWVKCLNQLFSTFLCKEFGASFANN